MVEDLAKELTDEQRKGVRAIQFLHTVAKTEEPEADSVCRWANMQEAERESTIRVAAQYKYMRGVSGEIEA